ncbi:MAG: MBL fold metallo-hydrolase [Candidatus Brocadiae bacterium]|nr:MBL fold metallo-hydrolase [Candidatus Brocadiia bacterium]
MQNLHFQELDHNITCIDTEFMHEGIASSYLIGKNGKYSLVETGPANSIPVLLACFDAKKISLESIEYVIVTHVHLDHAGGAGFLMQHLPKAILVVHPRGARHMADPSRLMAGAKEVYGEEAFKKNFGEILPIPSHRILEAKDGFCLNMNGRKLEFLDTPGHAKHHNCIWDAESQGMFTGDTFGISYPPFKKEKGTFLFASSSPVQFDPKAAHESIERIMKYNPRYVYPTHYGRFENVSTLAKQLHESIDILVSIATSTPPGPGREKAMQEKIKQVFLQKLQELGCTLDQETILRYWKTDIELNAQGLECWLKSQSVAS